MGGFDDHVAIMGDWMPPSPSPRTLFSSMLGDDVGSRSISNPAIDNNSGFSFPGPEEYTAPRNPDYKNGSEAMTADQAARFSGMSEPKVNSRGGLLERMAARAGFNAPRLNTEHIRPADISQNQDIQSPFLTIPPGLSPTTLLDSPVFVSNSLVQPSPTTGKFPFVSSGSIRSSSMMTEFTDKIKDNFFGNMNSSPFAFRTTPESGPSVFFNTSSRVNPTILPQQSFPGIEVSVQSENPSSLERPKATTLNEQTDFTKTSAEMETGVSSNLPLEQRTFNNIGGGMENSPSLDEQPDEDTDQRGNGDPNIGGTPADDEYNWRKYGQKQVKGSEYPRSYYKCTHPNCPVKKKVERSQEGHITEIIYKGAHSHPKPLPNCRTTLGSSNAISDMQLENSEQAGTGTVADDPVWTNVQRGNGASDWRNDNPEVTSTAAATLGTEYCNGATTTLQAQSGNQFESGDAIDRSSTFSNDEEEEDRATHGSVSLGYDGEGDESESKRRKVESYPTDMSGATRAIREPRVVVQTTSEVDILDDGYRWRKYGQKVVKGNPNPRSYYKCTSAGCTVRKHVERASHDLKSVITTYEGKHNHDVPAARNSSHVNGVSGNLPTQTTASAAAQTHVHRPEPSQLHHHHHHHHHHNNMTQFERPSSLGSFAMPARPPLGPNHSFGFGMNQQGLQNLAFAGLGHNNQGKMAVHPVHHHYLGQPQPQPQSMNDMGLMPPKGEPKVEPLSDPGLDISNGASVYHQAMNRMPLGPHM